MKRRKHSNKIILLLIIVVIALAFIIDEFDINKYNDKNYSEENMTETVEELDEFAVPRQQMVEKHFERRGIDDEIVLGAMNKVERHKFVPTYLIDQAYSDRPLPIGYGQTISQPYIVALMTQTLEVEEDDRVLEIGTGSGYQAAVLAEIVDEVYTIEIIEALATSATDRLESLGYENVEVKNADGYFGWEEQAPFDAIIVTAAANHIPPPLLQQLRNGGKLIIPLGNTKLFQTLTL